MKYPINADAFIKAAETQLGPVDDTMKQLLSLHIEECNLAHRQGLRQVTAKVTEFRDAVVDRIGDLCSWNDFNSLDLIDIVENIDDVLKEVQEEQKE